MLSSRHVVANADTGSALKARAAPSMLALVLGSVSKSLVARRSAARTSPRGLGLGASCSRSWPRAWPCADMVGRATQGARSTLALHRR